MSDGDPPVVVVGGGVAGIACARRLLAAGAGVEVLVLERGHRLGGRMATRTEQIAGREHRVDIGAPYFTVRSPGFAAVVEGWRAAGLVHDWTDTFTTAGPGSGSIAAGPGTGGASAGDGAGGAGAGPAGAGGEAGSTSGPMRLASTAGLRAAVEALAAPVRTRVETEVRRLEKGDGGVVLHLGGPEADRGLMARAVVLAMPDPQAARLLPASVAAELAVATSASSPVLTVWAAWPHRWWQSFDGVFVSGSEVLTWVADSGRARGDGAAVLVAHTTAAFAAAHAGSPSDAVQTVIGELRHVIGGPVPPPLWERVHRWSMASADEPHPEPFALTGGPAPIGVCGDGWGPRSRVEQAWLSGDALGRELAGRLAVL